MECKRRGLFQPPGAARGTVDRGSATSMMIWRIRPMWYEECFSICYVLHFFIL
jgi:hypothetical protein